MHEIKERSANATFFHSEQQRRWLAVLNLGVVVALHKSELGKRCFQRHSNFISMP
jgi:hypothetical protein